MKKLVLTLLSSLLLLAASPADLQAKQDPIVGVWLQNQTFVGDPSLVLASQAIFAADGTNFRNLDVDLQRVLGPPSFPEGTVFSISDDYSRWKKVGKGHYRCLGTQIALVKGEDGNFTPLARAKCEIDIRICGDSMTGTETLSFYDYYDLTLTIPFEALPTLQFTIEGKKL
ncbi:MAG: hypothetical protein JSR37_01980 [Verrucomicrobia bacterium]|nr:hypothetical protein [Verrucomicrobiota bacterium]MBS0637218.1 hypothetical protein [Verrucomicrobiota bacterium]